MWEKWLFKKKREEKGERRFTVKDGQHRAPAGDDENVVPNTATCQSGLSDILLLLNVATQINCFAHYSCSIDLSYKLSAG